MAYYCYLLVNNDNNYTYIGITNDLNNRLNKHNRLLKHGAKATAKSNSWKYHKIVGQFTKSSAGSFEWYWKNIQSKNGKWRTLSGLNNRIKRLDGLLLQNEWNYLRKILDK